MQLFGQAISTAEKNELRRKLQRKAVEIVSVNFIGAPSEINMKTSKRGKFVFLNAIRKVNQCDLM